MKGHGLEQGAHFVGMGQAAVSGPMRGEPLALQPAGQRFGAQPNP
jgi:hypothetical protein